MKLFDQVTAGAGAMSNDSHVLVSKHPVTMKTSARAGKKPHPAFALRLVRMAFGIGGRLFPRFAGRMAYRLWLTPTRFRTPLAEQQLRASAKLDYLDIDGIRLACYGWGSTGPVVLLVHGWSGRGTQLGTFVEPLLGAGYRVLSFDAPAHGSSSGRQTSLYQIADTILALNARLGPFSAVITHSFGGPCLAVAMQRGFTASSVVSISPPASVSVLVQQFVQMLAIPAKAEQDFVRRFKQAFGEDILEVASMEHNVRGLDVPALVIHDENDDTVPWQQGEIVARAWNNAVFIRTTGLGHSSILRDESTARAALDFIVSNARVA